MSGSATAACCSSAPRRAHLEDRDRTQSYFLEIIILGFKGLTGLFNRTAPRRGTFCAIRRGTEVSIGHPA
jgi:hypothetical protein